MMRSSLPASTISNDTDTAQPKIINRADNDEPPCGDKCTSETGLDNQAKKGHAIPFWAENPNILLRPDHLTEFFPTEDMSYAQKLNAVTRTVILFSVITFMVSPGIRAVAMCAITLAAIYILYHFHEKERNVRMAKRAENVEGFEVNGPVLDLLKYNNLPLPEDVFDAPDSRNPFGNVLVTDYDYNPGKKPAPPAANSTVAKDILKQAKKFVGEANPDHPGIADKLFNDIGSELMFEQSLRPFTSNPSTTIPNDQEAFADFCYGSMISCKEGNQFACARNLARYTN
jgi:hypothetical protein